MRLIFFVFSLLFQQSFVSGFDPRAEDDVERSVVLHGGFDVFYAEFFQGLGYFLFHRAFEAGRARSRYCYLDPGSRLRLGERHEAVH